MPDATAKPEASPSSSPLPALAPVPAPLAADVLIVGGGLIGLPLGVALAGAGLETIILDREDPARVVDAAFDGRVSAIAFASQAALAAIGVWHHVAEAQPILDIRVVDGTSPFFLHYDHRTLGSGPLGWMVENRVLRQALQQAVAATPRVRLLAPAAAAHVERGPHGVSARTDDGREIRAAIVVAADGRFSPLREAAGIPTLSWRYAQAGIVCTIAHERPHQGVATERFLPAGPFAMLPMTGNRSSLVWTEPAALAAAMMTLPPAEFRVEVARRFGDHLGALEVVGPRWTYPLALHHAERYIAHRLALAGDAAHGMHPIAGQGLNLGLRDVAALAEILVDAARLGLDIGDEGVLEAYQRRRRFDAMLLLAVTDGLNRLFSNDVAPVRLVRDLGLAAVNRMPPLKRLFMQHARGTLGALPRLLTGQPL